MRVTRRSQAALLLCLAVYAPGVAAGQAPPAAGPPATVPTLETLRVFLDCNTHCDEDYIRREITYVDWVRDRQDADVHLIITSQGTGGGGDEFTLRYIGLRLFRGLDDTLRFATRQSDTEAEIRQQQTSRIGLGLARYAARGANADRLRLTFRPPEQGDRGDLSQQARDPWNLWVFTLSASGHIESESEFRSTNLSGSFRARRVTERWKFSASIRGSRSTSRFELDSNEVVHSKRSDYTLALLGVRSLGPRWSFGLNGGGRRSSRDNYDLLLRIAPGIEYDLFPYNESSHRQFVLVYEIGLTHARYAEETIYSKLRETRASHAFTAALEAVQPWGQVDARLTASSFLDRWSQNRMVLGGGLEIRLVRGLNLDLNAQYSRVRDQISLSKAELSDEDVLLRLKQLRTDYFFFAAVGLSFNFGSKFNNVVNPRFNSSVFDF